MLLPLDNGGAAHYPLATCMDDVALRMRIPWTYSDVGGEKSQNGFKQGENRGRERRDDAPVVGSHDCGHCRFPKPCKRSGFQCERFRCPCDVDIALVKGPSDTSGALDGAEIGGSHKLSTSEPEICLLSSNVKSFFGKWRGCEDQRRIQQIKNALAYTERSNPVSVHGNINNSSRISYSNCLIPKTSGQVYAPNSRTSANIVAPYRLRKRCDTVYEPCRHPCRPCNARQPMWLRNPENRNALCLRRSRYQPYHIRCCDRRKHILRVVGAKSHYKADQAKFYQNDGRLSKDFKIFTPDYGNIFNVNINGLNSESRYTGMVSSCEGKQPKLVRFNTPIRQEKPGLRRLFHKELCSESTQNAINAGENPFVKTSHTANLHKPLFGFDYLKTNNTADREFYRRFPSPRLLVGPTQESAKQRRVELETPTSSWLRSVSGKADEVIERQSEVGRNNSCSTEFKRVNGCCVDFSGVNSGSSGVIPARDLLIEDLLSGGFELSPLTHSSCPLSSKANTSLVHNNTQPQFKFSSPIVALSESKQENPRFSLLSGVSRQPKRCFPLSSTPSRSLHGVLPSNTFLQPLDFDNIQSKSVSIERKPWNIFKSTENESTYTSGADGVNEVGFIMKQPVCPYRKRSANGFPTQGYERGGSDVVRPPHQCGLCIDTQVSDKIITSNNSRINYPWPTNNNNIGKPCKTNNNHNIDNPCQTNKNNMSRPLQTKYNHIDNYQQTNRNNNMDSHQKTNNNVDNHRETNNNVDNHRETNNNVDNHRETNNNSCSEASPSQAVRRTPLSGRVVKVEGDGRCLFRSLVTAEYRPLQLGWRDDFGRPVKRELSDLETARADQLRARVVAIMADNMHFYSQLERGVINADQPVPCSYQRFLDRLRAMSQPSTMPGDLELNAVAMVMERQVLVLDTNLAIITSYGHDRFPQSVPLAVRYTRLVADVGHYDAVILSDDQQAESCGGRDGHHDVTVHRPSSQLDLCGDFRRLTTSGDQHQTNDAEGGSTGSAHSQDRCSGNAKLNAKKEYFYLRDSDKSLHSDGLQPVASMAVKDAAEPAGEGQRTAEAATSTARAAVFWKRNSSVTRNRRRRRTFLHKFTQTDGGDGKPGKSDEEPEWTERYYQYRYAICKPYKGDASKKRRASAAFLEGAKRMRRELRNVDKGETRYQNINWNSRVRYPKVGVGRDHKTSDFKPVVKFNVQPKRLKKYLCGNKMKMNNCTGELTCGYSGTKGPLRTPIVKALAKRMGSWDATHSKKMKVVGMPTSAKTNGTSAKANAKFAKNNGTCAKNNPMRYINVCSPPTGEPRRGKSEGPKGLKPRAASPSVSSRKRRSMSVRHRARKRHVEPVRPDSPHSPLFVAKRPRLPDVFEPVQCRCVLCNNKIEATARDSAKCYMCGRMAHRACVMKESSGGSQGGGDQNYFICSFCAPL
ncbi:hypothetical protein EGW08_012961 [Elysia chlorotica]|uniref:Ubiquitin thioesterase OTU n=1 Tax=Elysia chlorotica TaxID=188477 RepID=A0A3S0ZNU6_ELYCH|nr:hypothetical protein EGW08_012961 [Elysia chlorotica]